MTPQSRLRLGALALLAATALSAPAMAQSTPPSSEAQPAALAPTAKPESPTGAATSTPPGEVVVTARHRTEDVEKTPVAVSVIGGDFLTKTNTTNISQISQYVPSLQFEFFNARNANINLRGIGNNVGLASDGIEPGVGFYVDGVYYDRPATSTFDLVDIDQIEVLRGPQGTLFGKNTTAGAINILTAGPTFTPQGIAEVTGGDYGYFQAKAAVSGALIDDVLAGRLSVSTSTRSGTLTNTYDDNKVNAYQNLNIRGQLLFEPTSNLKFRLIADYSKQDSNCCDLVLSGVVSPPNGKNFTALSEALGYTPVIDPFARHADTNSNIQAHQETGGFSLQGDWTVPGAIITSITSWRFWNWWPANDSDYTPLSVLTLSQNGDYQTQYSQELRIASTGQRTLDYTAGIYLFREDIKAVGATQYGNAASAFLLSPALPASVANGYTLDFQGRFRTTSLAAFGQTVWHITPKWNLTTGLRYTYDHKDGWFDQVATGGVPLTGALAAFAPYRAALGTADAFTAGDSEGDLSGLIDLSYQATPHLLAYATYSRGTKSGGLNLVQLPAGASAIVKPETLDAVEAGVKTRWFDRRLTVNADVFWENDDDYQANVYDPTLVKLYLSNVPEVRSQGVEIDATARPTNNLSLYTSVTYDDATYASYADAPCPLELVNLSHCNLSGRPLAGVPKWAAAAGGEYDHPLTIIGREAEAYIGLDYSFRSSLYSAASDSIYSRLGDLNLLNARLGVRAPSGRWDVYVWAKNLTGENYFTFVSAGVGNTGALTAQLGDPRTVGATLRVRY